MSPRERYESPKDTLKLLSNVNIESSVAVYIQIENSIRFAIANGQLKAGDRLPSVRELSELLKVNPNTIAKSYRDLEVMGILYTRRGMGVFVNQGIEAKCRKDIHKEIAERLFEVVAEAKAAGYTVGKIDEILKKSYGLSEAPYTQAPASVRNLASKGS